LWDEAIERERVLVFEERLEGEPLAEKRNRLLTPLVVAYLDRALVAKCNKALKDRRLLDWNVLDLFLNTRIVLLLTPHVDGNRYIERNLGLRHLFGHQLVLVFRNSLSVKSRQGVAEFSFPCDSLLYLSRLLLVKNVKRLHRFVESFQVGVVYLALATQNPETVVH
jgi:hypothetical protein